MRKTSNNDDCSGRWSRWDILHRPFFLFLVFQTPPLLFVHADFGDYVDDVDHCPLMTTCPKVCVWNVEDCLTSCPNDAPVLCPDGHCRIECNHPHHFINPCASESSCNSSSSSGNSTTTLVTCLKVDDYYDLCSTHPIPDNAVTCSEEKDQQSTTTARPMTVTEQVLLWFLFLWIIGITIAIIRFSRSNYHHPASTLPAQSAYSDPSTSTPPGVLLLGYQHSRWGNVLYALTVCTFLGIQIILFVLVLLYYLEQMPTSDSVISKFQTVVLPWKDEHRILFTFEMVWMIGFVWSLWISWPTPRLKSIFRRPCTSLDHAEIVAVWTSNHSSGNKSNSSSTTMIHSNDPWIAWLRIRVGRMYAYFNACISKTFYSMHDPRRHYSSSFGQWQECPVITDLSLGSETKYFVHNFRRHIITTTATTNGTIQSEQPLESVWQPPKMNQQQHCIPLPQTLQEYAKYYNHNDNDDDNKIHSSALENSIMRGGGGLKDCQVHERLRIVGPNFIEMRPPSFLRVVKEEFTRTYYIYQNFIMWTWMPLFYYYMAVVQTLVIVTGGLVVCVFRYRNERSLHRLSHMEGTVSVLRNQSWNEIHAQQLVPGDIVQIRPGPIHCDMVLIREDILVDESALTGESNPIPKSAVDETDRSPYQRQKRHTLQAGTTVVECDDLAIAVVTQTGSFTTKGELLRDIFSFQRHQFKFDVEVPIVLMILFVYTIIAFTIVVAQLSYSIDYGWFYGMYVVAACLPPLLPTAFTVSVGVSDNRLQKEHNIACTNSEDIIIAGKVKRAFFDKTGTLTKQGLEFLYSRSADTWDQMDDSHSEAKQRSPYIAMGMATCHSLVASKLAEGELIGNPVDRTMFAASGGQLLPSTAANGNTPSIMDANGNQLEILRHFDFDHHRMTLSTIVRNQADGRLLAFVKGSGESVSRLCRTETLPSDFGSTLRSSAKAGIYQISMAVKELPSDTDVMHVSRDDIERDLSFLGVINFRNVMREETPGVVAELEAGEVRCIMITGDSVLTGISIAKESNIIADGRQVFRGELDGQGLTVWYDEDDNVVSFPDEAGESLYLQNANIELAVTGELWSKILQSDRERAAVLADSIRVYGRCTPSDKVSVVTHFADRGFTTLMCGDGGNDCGALKTAHVGIALSDAEASIVAPFTSLDKTITSVVAVLREGRCALASALANYKFLIMYGQLTVVSHYFEAFYRITYSEWCWIFVDGFWVIGLGFTLPLAKPAPVLAPTRPTSSLLGPLTMASAVGVLAINVMFTGIAIGLLNSQDWYQCRKWAGEDISNVLIIGDNYESETLFIMFAYQLLATAITYNFGYEWRGKWWSNEWFVLLIFIFTVINVYVILVPGTISCLFRMNCTNEFVLRSISTWELYPIQNHWNTTEMPWDYRITMVILIAMNTLTVVCYDYFGVNGIRKRMAKKKRQNAIFVAPKAPSEGPV